MTENSRSSLYWLQSAAARFEFMGKHMSYREFAVALPTMIVVGHLVIASITSGLPRFFNDVGLVLTSAAWIAMLLAIERYTIKLHALDDYIADAQGTSGSGLSLGDRIMNQRWIVVTGVLAAASELAILVWDYNPSQFVTGFQELPYNGQLALAMKYASIPAYLWTNFFWGLFFFILGNCLWFSVSSMIIIPKRLTSLRLKKSSSRNEDWNRKSSSLGRSAILAAVSALVLPLFFLAPMASADISNPLLLPRLATVYGFLALLLIVLLGATLASVRRIRVG